MRRRGQSSIVGGTFLVLIILTSYGLYTTYNRNMTSMATNVREMQQKDLDRGIEDLDFYYKNRDDKFMDLYLRNTGSLTINIIIIADLDKFHFEDVKHYNIHINPTVEYNVSDFLDLYYDPGFTENNTLQLVSTRGNTYETDYIPVVTSYVTWKELSDELAALISIFGDFIFDFDSFGWAHYNESDWAIQPWMENWDVLLDKDPKTYVVFRINVTYYGEEPSVTLGEESTMFFRQLSDASSTDVAEIATARGGYNNERFAPYEGQTFTFNQTRTLYFMTTKDLAARNHDCSVSLFDESLKYSQNFPLISIRVRTK